MTRILTVTSWYPPHHFGGYELSCFDVMTRLITRGHEVRVLCGDERIEGARASDPDHESLVHRELRPHTREAGGGRPTLAARLAIERANQERFAFHLDSFRPEVVSVWHLAAISAGLLKTLTDRAIPVVDVVCDNWPVYARANDPWISLFDGGVLRALAGRVLERVTGVPTSTGRFADDGAFCFVSESTRRLVVADRPWSYPLSTVVYSGIEPADFHAPARRDEPSEPGWKLLYVGRLDAWKGVDTLLRALALLPHATLDCFGRGAERERGRLRALADSLGIAERVTFGSLERTELAARYADADVFVFPSEWPEPFGLVPIEAMACGTPVVATGVGGSGEFLRDGANCVLFRAADPTALAAAVQRVHDDDGLRCRIVQGGRCTARTFDVGALADTLEAWHVGAATRFQAGVPRDRALRLPTADGADARTVAVDDPLARTITEVADRAAPGVAVTLSPGAEAVADAGRTVVAVATAHNLGASAPIRGRIVHVLARADALPFRSGSVAVVLSGPPGDASARETARVLAPNGTAVFAAPNRDDALHARARIRERVRFGPVRPGPFASVATPRAVSTRALEQAIAPHLRVTRRRAVPWTGGGKRAAVSRLTRLGPLRRFGPAVVFEARPR